MNFFVDHISNEKKLQKILRDKNLTDAQKRKKALKFLDNEGY